MYRFASTIARPRATSSCSSTGSLWSRIRRALSRVGDSGRDVKTIAIETPHGQAKAHLHVPPDPAGALVLGHGAGGGIKAPDLAAATDVARSLGIAVALVEQPYRVAGRRSPAP